MRAVPEVIKFKPAECHPDRKHWCKGMCQPCYNKSWFDAHPAYQRDRYAARLAESRASVSARAAKRKASCAGLTAQPATAAERAALLAPGELCFYCEKRQAEHVDHYIPIARWSEVRLTAQQQADGPNHISNLVGACAKCNLSKNAKLPDVEWRGRESEPPR